MAHRLIPTSCLLILSATSALSMDIPYGIEAVTQYRSEYNFRAFDLANETIGFQLGANYALDNSTTLTTTLWQDSETGDGDFAEAGALVSLAKDIGETTFSLSGIYRSYSNSFLESGTNIEAAVHHNLTDNLSSSATLAYDTGADGLYAELSLQHYHRINDKSFLSVTGGISYVEDYYQLSGLNDTFVKVGYTYNINQSVSIAPYIATSVLLDNTENRRHSLHAGAYFAVSF